MATEFKAGDRVEHVGKHYIGHVKYVDVNEILVKNEKTGQNNLVGRAWLVHASAAKPEPIKPGWYRVRNKPASNFLYYIAAELGNTLFYTHAFNPVTGEMDTFGFGSLAIVKQALDVARGDLIPQSFRDAA